MADQVQQVKQRTDIVSIIDSRVPLKPAGKYLKGLCPFHAEKSPSFFVSPEIQVYKCYGCGKSGDVFTFLEDYEGMTFREALETLAERAGITLEGYQQDKSEEQVTQYKQVLNLAQEFYHYILMSHPAADAARRYLSKRNIPEGLIKKFNLGCAPDSWHSLERYLVGKKKFDPEIVSQTGLLIQRDGGRGGYYDRFRNRIMFPLTDFRGQVVGFSGRTLSEDTKEAKYINTPETKLYRKRELLFGIHSARPAMRKKDQAILVEGEFDVISSVKAGVHQVAGIKGSALTEDHVKLLMRLTRNVVLCLDADAAGDAATKRGIEVADKLGMNVSILPLKGGKDPDELAQDHPDKWKELVSNPQSIYDFYIESAFKQFDEATGRGKKQITMELVPVLAGITNSVEQAHYVQVVSKRLQVASEALESEIEKHIRKQELKAVPKSQQPTQEPLNPQTEDRLEKLEQHLWSWWLQSSKADSQLTSLFMSTQWYSPGLSRLANELSQYFDKHSEFDLKQFVANLPAELNQLVQHLYLSDVSVDESLSADQVRGLFEKSNQLRAKRTIQDLSKSIARLEQEYNLSQEDQTQLSDLRQKVSQAIQNLHQN